MKTNRINIVLVDNRYPKEVCKLFAVSYVKGNDVSRIAIMHYIENVLCSEDRIIVYNEIDRIFGSI